MANPAPDAPDDADAPDDLYATAARLCPAMGYVFVAVLWGLSAIVGLDASTVISRHPVYYLTAFGPVVMLGLVGLVCWRKSRGPAWWPLPLNVLLISGVIGRYFLG